MGPENLEFARQLGELSGRFDALDGKVEGIGQDVKQLLRRDAERAGGEKAEHRVEARGAHREQIIAGLFGGGLGAGIATLAQALLRKIGWSA